MVELAHLVVVVLVETLLTLMVNMALVQVVQWVEVAVEDLEVEMEHFQMKPHSPSQLKNVDCLLVKVRKWFILLNESHTIDAKKTFFLKSNLNFEALRILGATSKFNTMEKRT